MDGRSRVLGCGQSGGNVREWAGPIRIMSALKTLILSTYSQDTLIPLVAVLTFLFGRQQSLPALLLLGH